MLTHHPISFAHDLSAKLATRSRHVCLFLGAGAARACGLPDVTQLEESVLAGLGDAERERFQEQLLGRNLEQALSRLRRIAALLQPGDRVDGLTSEEAEALDRNVCRLIIKSLDLSGADLVPSWNLAAWAARGDYHLPIELFTVNYDLLLETGFEALGVPYFDGFVGALRARFRTELVEASPEDGEDWLPGFFLRLWKLHGSVNWAWESGSHPEVVRLGTPVEDDKPAAIYPSDAKYDESRRVPFVVLQDRFRRALHQRETLMLITGYSFSDAHLNEILFDAARRRQRSELVAFCFSDIPSVLSDQAAVNPNLQVVSPAEAIIGGVRGQWAAPDDAPEHLWNDGAFTLGDFAKLASFLARSSPPQGELEARLSELLSKVDSG